MPTAPWNVEKEGNKKCEGLDALLERLAAINFFGGHEREFRKGGKVGGGDKNLDLRGPMRKGAG